MGIDMGVEVIAIIVTYNRKEMIKKLLQSLKILQLKKIVVIDNSDLMNNDIKPNKNIIYYKTKTNIGGAGGYALGIEKAMAFKPQFLWLLDDDSIPDVFALDQLLKSYIYLTSNDFNISFLCSKVKWRDSDDDCKMNIPTYSKNLNMRDNLVGFKKVDSCSFVSLLVPLDKISECGLPLSEYFIWFDDVEYTIRLSSYGDGFQVENSIIRHYTDKNIGANFSYLDCDNLFKYKYGIRNMVSFYLYKKNIKKVYQILIRVFKEMHEGKVAIRLRGVIFLWYFLGFFFNPQIRYVQS